MFDIDRELNDIRSINMPPSKELIKETKRLVETKLEEADRLRKVKRKNNIISISSFAALPAAAAVLFAVIIGMVAPNAEARYSLNINPALTIESDAYGNVKSIDYEEYAWEGLDEKELEGKSVEYVISEAIVSAYEDDLVEQDENVLIGCFGEDEYNNISKNQIQSLLEGRIDYNLNLMSVHGTEDDWQNAEKLKLSPGLYMLSTYSKSVDLYSDVSLDDLITQIEHAENKDIQLLLLENQEPIIYDAPNLNYKIDGDYIVFSWKYIDYRQNNYDGNITYKLVSSDVLTDDISSMNVLDTYSFASWSEQPVDYTLPYDDDYRQKYYAVVAEYDDGTRAIRDTRAYIP